MLKEQIEASRKMTLTGFERTPGPNFRPRSDFGHMIEVGTVDFFDNTHSPERLRQQRRANHGKNTLGSTFRSPRSCKSPVPKERRSVPKVNTNAARNHRYVAAQVGMQNSRDGVRRPD